MFNPTRDQARLFFIDSWRKYRSGGTEGILSPLEHVAVDLVQLHPEYHTALERPDQALAQNYFPESGETNPFLHLSLHLAIEEQLSIDQPPGIRMTFDRLCARLGDRHGALHTVLECLGETIWRAQRDKTPMDAAAYLDCIRRTAG